MKDGEKDSGALRMGKSDSTKIKRPLGRDGRPARLVTLFGSLGPSGEKLIHYVFDVAEPAHMEIILNAAGGIKSISREMPAATWYERELHDQFGVEISGHPDLRPLLFHENWPDGVYPMVDSVKSVPWSNRGYNFLEVQGEGIAEVAVGPVHAGIIEPGHFRFSVVGDTVLHLELRHFYTHKGTEKLFDGTHFSAGAMIAESVSGDNCFAHAVAYSQAVESACVSNEYQSNVPPRAHAIRLIGLEFERLVCHISDVGGLCTDVGFTVGAACATSIKESLLQLSSECCGTRFWRGIAVPGGLSRPLDAGKILQFGKSVSAAARRFADLAKVTLETPSIQNRFEAAGILRKDAARELAVVGPVARASGIDLDVRRDHPYGHYARSRFEVPVTHFGDVMARARIRIDEAATSARLIQETALDLPSGSVLAPLRPVGEFRGFSSVESPRGELYYWLEGSDEYLTRCHVKSPSFQNWPAMPFAVVDNIIADFPLINKSFNLSYSGCDR
jgi:Ni,Fe-hydrogenase III large subunit